MLIKTKRGRLTARTLKLKSNGVYRKVNGVSRRVGGIRIKKKAPITKRKKRVDYSDAELLEILLKVRNGNFSVRLPLGKAGIKRSINETLNEIIDLNERMVIEIERVENRVGKEGKLSSRVELDGARGAWDSYVDSVNGLISSLVYPVIEVGRVISSVNTGNLTQDMPLSIDGKPLQGEFLRIGNDINIMVGRLSLFSFEVTRLVREVGVDGKLGGQARVTGVSGSWKVLVDEINQMSGNLADQMQSIISVSNALASGDMTKRVTADVRGEFLVLKETIHLMIDQVKSLVLEVTRVAREVGSDGKLGGQVYVDGVTGSWKNLADGVNEMADNLTLQVRNIAEVTKAVVNGDLSKTISVNARGEILDLKNTINVMVEQLNSFVSEVTRVAHEVGVEGKLGGQSQTVGVAGTWKVLTDSVNLMAFNLANQVRGIANVVTSVAKGNLKQKLFIDANGEVALLTETINEMIDTLATFSDQVTTVAHEVGAEGKLGGQANVPGASGTWKNLTDNVNQLAANLTTQVRAISEVAAAVTQGDLTRKIRVDAKGEVEALKDTINQMITNLKITTLRNQDQDWLKSNLTKFTQMLQGQKELNSVTSKILSELAQIVKAQHGLFYVLNEEEKLMDSKLRLIASYAFKKRKSAPVEFSMGEGLVGQCALQKERILVTDVPDSYIRISSGLGEAKPLNVIILPVLFEGHVKAVIELASFDLFTQTHQDFLNGLTESIGIVLNTIESNSRTEALLVQSQSLASELKSQQEVLRNANEELEEKAVLLANQKEEVEKKNKEVEESRKALEEKANQLSLTSKYKSEFLANMSHELRTPLNSLQILANELIANHEGNLTEKQIQYAKTINGCGDDLIELINDILDLSKIESGYLSVDYAPVSFSTISKFVESTFNHIAEAKHLKFSIEVEEGLPEFIYTDSQRLSQILKNLLSNSFKFTEKGEVKLRIFKTEKNLPLDGRASKGQPAQLNKPEPVVGFEISDTGIGISKDKQNIIFEAFQQAEGSTSRKYGGTGLGLSISRGLSDLLGGTIELESEPEKGSKFTLFLPIDYEPSVTHKPIESETKPVLKSEARSSAALVQNGPNLELFFEDEAGDDRNSIKPGDKVVVIAENDLRIASIMIDKAHENGIKAVVTTKMNDVVDFINQFNPVAITIDMDMPDTSGWKILDRLKTDLRLRHIPIYIVAGEDARSNGLKRGVRNFLIKPIKVQALNNLFNDINDFSNKKVKQLLIVDDSEDDLPILTRALEFNDVEITIAKTAKEAIGFIREKSFDCIILDLVLPDAPGLDIVKELESENVDLQTALIVYSAKNITKREKARLDRYANRIILKGAHSLEQLTDQVALFLHRVHKDLPEPMRDIIENIHEREDILRGRKVLIVDDDVRNLFALTTALERVGLKVHSAESGKEAIHILERTKDIDIVLMDIMMPEMDGYETMRMIRADESNRNLTIIAVTAKAMKGDRQKCIEAGASDYITKPVNVDQLLSLMRVWIH